MWLFDFTSDFNPHMTLAFSAALTPNLIWILGLRFPAHLSARLIPHRTYAVLYIANVKNPVLPRGGSSTEKANLTCLLSDLKPMSIDPRSSKPGILAFSRKAVALSAKAVSFMCALIASGFTKGLDTFSFRTSANLWPDPVSGIWLLNFIYK
jgi:hypothetical protein